MDNNSDETVVGALIAGLVIGALLTMWLAFGIAMPNETRFVRKTQCLGAIYVADADQPVRWNEDNNRCELEISDGTWTSFEGLTTGD